MFSKKIDTLKKGYISGCQKLGAALNAPSKTQGKIMFALMGATVACYLVGGVDLVSAQNSNPFPDGVTGNTDDGRIAGAVSLMFRYIEGSFGALIMVVAGLVAIVSSAFGQYKAALSALIVAVGAFILRSLVNTFFNTTSFIDG